MSHRKQVVNETVTLRSLGILLLLITLPIFADDDDIVIPEPITFDVATLLNLFGPPKSDIPESAFKKATIVALLQRDWSIDTVQQTKITGKHRSRDNRDDIVVEISYHGTVVTIQFIGGEPDNYYERWLDNLKKDFIVALAYVS